MASGHSYSKRFSTPTVFVSFKGGRHLHEIFNESIILMSHFSIGMIDIHKKISLREKKFKFKMAAAAGVQK